MKDCPCVFCEVDRKKSRPRYVVRWQDTGVYYAPSRPGSVADRQREAVAYGPRHEFGPAFRRFRLTGARRVRR